MVALCWVFVVNVLLITEVHYVSDVVGGLILSLWAYRTSIRVVGYVDRAISFPFKVGKKVYEKYGKRVEEGQQEEFDLAKEELIDERT